MAVPMGSGHSCERLHVPSSGVGTLSEFRWQGKSRVAPLSFLSAFTHKFTDTTGGGKCTSCSLET